MSRDLNSERSDHKVSESYIAHPASNFEGDVALYNLFIIFLLNKGSGGVGEKALYEGTSLFFRF